MAFRSGLEEKVADLMVDLGIDYEYETEKVPYTIEHIYTPDFFLPNGSDFVFKHLMLSHCKR